MNYINKVTLKLIFSPKWFLLLLTLEKVSSSHYDGMYTTVRLMGNTLPMGHTSYYVDKHGGRQRKNYHKHRAKKARHNFLDGQGEELLQGRYSANPREGFALASMEENEEQSVEEILKRYPGQDDLIAPKASITAVEGGETSLPCKLQPLPHRSHADTPHLVLWYRSDVVKPVYSYDTRSGEAVHWHNFEVLGDRANYSPTRSILMLKNVKVSDAVTYKCRLDYRIDPTVTIKVKLSVIVPPRTLTIVTPSTGKRVGRTVGPLVEGMELTLACTSEGGAPIPTVMWFTDNHLIESSGEEIHDSHVTQVRSTSVTVNGGTTVTSLSPRGSYETLQVATKVTNTLRVKPLIRTDQNRTFTCKSSNTNLTQPIEITIQIELNLPPSSVNISGPSEPLVAGRMARFECEAKGAKPAAEITWYIQDKPLHNFTNEVVSTLSSDGESLTVSLSRLFFTPKRHHHDKPIACVARQSDSRLSPVTASEYIKVFYPPVTTLKAGGSLNLSSIQEDDDVYFDCEVDASPSAYKITWFHQGIELEQNISAGILHSHHSLVVQRVNRESGGTYFCRASNIEGDGDSNELQLYVQYSPVCASPLWQYRGASLLEELTVFCELDALPPVQSVKWTFNNTGESVRIGKDHITTELHNSSARYTPLTELDYGSLLCWGTNPVGTQRVPCGVQIFPAAPPDAPQNCSQLNLSSDSVGVKCDPGFNGGLTQVFTMQIFDSESEALLANVSSEEPILWASKLPSSSAFKVFIFSRNNKGRSRNVRLVVNTLRDQAEKRTAAMKPPPDHLSSPGLSPVIIIGIAAAMGLILVLILILLALKLKTNGLNNRRNSGVRGIDNNLTSSVVNLPQSVKYDDLRMEDALANVELRQRIDESEKLDGTFQKSETPSFVHEDSNNMNRANNMNHQFPSNNYEDLNCDSTLASLKDNLVLMSFKENRKGVTEGDNLTSTGVNSSERSNVQDRNIKLNIEAPKHPQSNHCNLQDKFSSKCSIRSSDPPSPAPSHQSLLYNRQNSTGTKSDGSQCGWLDDPMDRWYLSQHTKEAVKDSRQGWAIEELSDRYRQQAEEGDKVYSKTLGREVKRRSKSDMEFFIKSLRELGYDVTQDQVDQLKLEQSYQSNESLLRSIDNLVNKNLFVLPNEQSRRYSTLPGKSRSRTKMASAGVRSKKLLVDAFNRDDMAHLASRNSLSSSQNSNGDSLLEGLIPSSVLTSDRESSV